MFCNSGAEANEAALKLAAKHTRRAKFVACQNSFHGRTAGALSATGQRKYQEGFEPLALPGLRIRPFQRQRGLKSMVSKDTAAVMLEIGPGGGRGHTGQPRVHEDGAGPVR